MESISEKSIELTSEVSALEIGQWINEVRRNSGNSAELVSMLSERHPVYKGRGGNQTARIKGYALASFENIGLPAKCITYVLDELENGQNAYLIAASARALRGSENPTPQFVSYLFKALKNIRLHDDSLSLDEFQPTWPIREPTSARKEIFKTFLWLKGHAKAAIPDLEALLNNPFDFDTETRNEISKAIAFIRQDLRDLDLSCCSINTGQYKGVLESNHRKFNMKEINDLEIENQDGLKTTYGKFLSGKPTLVTFFYSRCMNPNKCTLTINKLAQLQQLLSEHGLSDEVNIAAFTYDSEYDTAERMHTFGSNRGLIFTDSVQMFRANPDEYEKLSDFFQLGVNYASSAVNQHRLELFILNEKAVVDTSYLRLQWDIEEVLSHLQKLSSRSGWSSWIKAVGSVFRNVISPILIAFFPKCPMCWAAYMSVFGIAGLQQIPYSPWLIPVLALGVGVNLFFLYRGARIRHGMKPFFISCVGAFSLLIPGYLMDIEMFLYAGISLLMIGSMLNSLPYRLFNKVSKWSPFRTIKELFGNRLKATIQ